MIKKIVFAIFFLAVMSAAFLMPSLLFRAYDQTVMDKVNTESFAPLTIEGKLPPTLLEKINMLAQNGSIFPYPEEDKEMNSYYERVASDQLLKLQGMAAFPKEVPLELMTAVGSSTNLLTSGDQQAPIARVDLSADGYSVNLTLDVETKLILQYEVYGNYNDAYGAYTDAEVSAMYEEGIPLSFYIDPISFGNYLGLNLEVTGDSTLFYCQGNNFFYRFNQGPSALSIFPSMS